METMNNLDAALAEVEGRNGSYDDGYYQEQPYEIHVKHGVSFQKTSIKVLSANTLGQVFNKTAQEIGIDPRKDNSIFMNEQTGSSTTDSTMTVGEFGLINGSTVVVHPDGKVAAE